jgi:UDP-2,4-diacetamido-2,4,6-trideoxy-beta-L-altropyranose hydrolase
VTSFDLVFRVDSSTVLGSGHVSRCLVMADLFQKTGWKSLFIMRDLKGNLGKWVAERGHSVAMLQGPADPALDIVQCKELFEHMEFRPQWLVLDHYTLAQEWERELLPSVQRIFVIEDHFNRPHTCHAVLNQNLMRELHSPLPFSPDTVIFSGPQYALLTPPFLRDRPASRQPGSPSRILVFMGGNDLHNLTGKVIGTLIPHLKNIHSVKVIAGSSHPFRSSLETQCAVHDKITLISHTDQMAQWIESVDFCIGGGGVSTWERLKCGRWTIAFAMAENQTELLREAQRRQWLDYQGIARDFHSEKLARALSPLWNTANLTAKYPAMKDISRVISSRLHELTAFMASPDSSPTV